MSKNDYKKYKKENKENKIKIDPDALYKWLKSVVIRGKNDKL